MYRIINFFLFFLSVTKPTLTNGRFFKKELLLPRNLFYFGFLNHLIIFIYRYLNDGSILG